MTGRGARASTGFDRRGCDPGSGAAPWRRGCRRRPSQRPPSDWPTAPTFPVVGVAACLSYATKVRESIVARRRERKRIGRPAEFRARTRLTVLLEASELTVLYRLAKNADVSASAYVRRLIQAALRRAGES